MISVTFTVLTASFLAFNKAAAAGFDQQKEHGVSAGEGRINLHISRVNTENPGKTSKWRNKPTGAGRPVQTKLFMKDRFALCSLDDILLHTSKVE